MSLEFRPKIKSINVVSSDETKITLVVTNGSLQGKVEELSCLMGETITLAVVPETYTYRIPYNAETQKPNAAYLVNTDGTVEFKEEEQTALEIDGKTIEIEDREFVVDKDICDEFIRKAKSLEFPGEINPREVLIALDDGESLKDIAEWNDMSETVVMKELEKARMYYAPYADAWSKKRDQVDFEAQQAEQTENDTETAESDTGNAIKDTETSLNDSTSEENETISKVDSEEKEETNSDDPY